MSDNPYDVDAERPFQATVRRIAADILAQWTDSDGGPKSDPEFNLLELRIAHALERFASRTTGGEAMSDLPRYGDAERLSEVNRRVQRRYDELRLEAKHGIYETIFRVVHEERDAALREANAEIERLRQALAALDTTESKG